MADPVIVVPYDARWPVQFRERAAALRHALGDVALRIDHVGSTAVPGLDAKPVLDLQISVAALEPVDPFRDPLERLGYVFRPENPDRSKRYFREAAGEARIHVHVRRAGSWSEQLTLLFRDYLRGHPDDAARYAALKRGLAEKFRDRRERYTEAKGAFLWEILKKADRWAQATGWEPGAPDR